MKGGFSFREAWFHSLDDMYPIKHEAERLPPPIVTDRNGDGRNFKEIVVITHDAKILILEPTYAKGDENFMEARFKAEKSLLRTLGLPEGRSLLPEKVQVTTGWRSVAMATGVVSRHLRPGESVGDKLPLRRSSHARLHVRSADTEDSPMLLTTKSSMLVPCQQGRTYGGSTSGKKGSVTFARIDKYTEIHAKEDTAGQSSQS